MEEKVKEYHDLCQKILDEGDSINDRTGVGTYRIFGHMLTFDLRKGFPAITTKKLAWKAVVGELLWFIEGSGDERRLAEITHGTREDAVTIWTPNALAPYWKQKAKYEGDLGRVYGVQWRTWYKYTELVSYGKSHYGGERIVADRTEVDQLSNLIANLKSDPYSRRHIISAWNTGELDQMVLPPCHMLCQFFVNSNKELSCRVDQRSVDVFLGLPFNIASYALLTHLVAQSTGLKVGKLIIQTGDTHIYHNHVDQVKELLTRTEYPLPTLYLNYDKKNIDDFTTSDIILDNYQSHGPLKAVMAV
jgi:thymidylate synthase